MTNFTNIALYDLEASPITFDCLQFMLMAQAFFACEKEDHFSLVIVPPSKTRIKSLNTTYKQSGSEYVDNRIESILKPCSILVEKLRNIVVLDNRMDAIELVQKSSSIFPQDFDVENPKAWHTISKVISNHNKGLLLPNVLIPKSELSKAHTLLDKSHGRKIISITLRNTKYQTERNSNVENWIKLAEHIVKQGYEVIWIDDPDNYSSIPLAPGKILPLKTYGNLLKGAIYQTCDLNFFVTHGPSVLSLYNHFSKSISFKVNNENCSSTSLRYWRNLLISPGDQFKFISPLHKMVWEEDAHDNLIMAFDKLGKFLISLNKEQQHQLVNDWANSAKVSARKTPVEKRTATKHTFEYFQTSNIHTHYLWSTPQHYSDAKSWLDSNKIAISGVINNGPVFPINAHENSAPASSLVFDKDVVVWVYGFRDNGQSIFPLVSSFIDHFIPELSYVYNLEDLSNPLNQRT